MRFSCSACASPAVVLPEELFDDALVHCRDCHQPIATWAVFKQRTTQIILSEIKEIGAQVEGLSYDPLDVALVQEHRSRRRASAQLG